MRPVMEPSFRCAMAVKLGAVLMLVAIVQRTESTCSFPSALTGTWKSSSWGDMVFSSGDQVTVSNLAGLGTVLFQCEVTSDSTYVIRSVSTLTVLNNAVYVASCLELTELSSVKFSYFHSTSEVQFKTGSEPVRLVSPSVSVTIASTCDSTSHTTGTNHMMIASGSETAAAIQCPNPMLATFNNCTIDKGSGSQCGGVGYINICNDLKSIAVNYTVCNEEVFYSSDGSLECLHYSTSGSNYYVNVYNLDSTVDDSTTFRFSCVAIAYGSGGYVYATQYPMACDSTQTPTSVPSSPYQGGTLELVANVPTSSSGSSNIATIIVIVILLLIIIVLVALAVYHFYYKKRWPAFKRKITCADKKVQKIDPMQPEKVTAKEEVKLKDQVRTEVETKLNDPDPKERPVSGVPLASSAQPEVTQEPVKTMKPADSADDHEVTAITTTTSEILGEGEDTLTVSHPRRLPPLEAHAGTPTQEVVNEQDS